MRKKLKAKKMPTIGNATSTALMVAGSTGYCAGYPYYNGGSYYITVPFFQTVTPTTAKELAVDHIKELYQDDRPCPKCGAENERAREGDENARRVTFVRGAVEIAVGKKLTEPDKVETRCHRCGYEWSEVALGCDLDVKVEDAV